MIETAAKKAQKVAERLKKLEDTEKQKAKKPPVKTSRKRKATKENTSVKGPANKQMQVAEEAGAPRSSPTPTLPALLRQKWGISLG